MFTRRATLAASRKTILARPQCRFQASPADTRIGAAVTRNPLLSVGLGVATAVAGYTVFCYSKNEESDVNIDDALAGQPKAARPAAYGKHGSIEDQINEDAKRQKNKDASDKLNDAKQKGKELKDKASDKLDDVKDKANDAKDDAKQKGKELKDKASDKLDDAKDKAKDAKDDAKQKGKADNERDLRASRESEESQVSASGAGSKSKSEGNASTRRATNPNEQEEKPTAKSSGKTRAYATGDEINKADNLSLDGGSRVGRDGQAKTDRAKIIERAGAQEGQENDIDDGAKDDGAASRSTKGDQKKQAEQRFDELTDKSLNAKESARDKINKFQQSALRDDGDNNDQHADDDEDANSNIGHHVTGSASRDSANPRNFSAGAVTNRPTNNESVRNYYIEKVRENEA